MPLIKTLRSANMRTTSAILNKILTQRFYIQNTGFFLVFFYLLFGVVNAGNLLNYHKALMLGFLGNNTFLLLALLLIHLSGAGRVSIQFEGMQPALLGALRVGLTAVYIMFSVFDRPLKASSTS